jgi:putative membrane protein
MPNNLDPALAYLTYIVSSFALMGLFVLIYTAITPHREVELIRSGNLAAALSLGGAALGFSLTLSSSIQHNATFTLFLLWALGALAVQVVTYLAMAKTLGNVSQAIADDNRAMGALMGTISLAAGIVNAACLS